MSNLRQALWRLRKLIGAAYLLANNQTVALNPDASTWIDVTLILNRSGYELAEAVEVYEGELLPGYYEEWALQERERIRWSFEDKLRRLSRLPGSD